jgi:hypothetical protein
VLCNEQDYYKIYVDKNDIRDLPLGSVTYKIAYCNTNLLLEKGIIYVYDSILENGKLIIKKYARVILQDRQDPGNETATNSEIDKEIERLIIDDSCYPVNLLR